MKDKGGAPTPRILASLPRRPWLRGAHFAFTKCANAAVALATIFPKGSGSPKGVYGSAMGAAVAEPDFSG
jgi:hypothetical protein